MGMGMGMGMGMLLKDDGLLVVQSPPRVELLLRVN